MHAAILVPVAACLAAAAGRSEPCGCVPTVPVAPITILDRPGPPPPVWLPPVTVPGPKLIRVDHEPPTYAPPVPMPPIRMFPKEPPAVVMFSLTPPDVRLFRKEAEPPRYASLEPPPPLRLFYKTPEPPTEGPTIVKPSVRLFHKEQPGLEWCPKPP
jgi:hypothetical protein